MAGSRYDRTTIIKRSNIHQDSPACLPDLLFVIVMIQITRYRIRPLHDVVMPSLVVRP